MGGLAASLVLSCWTQQHQLPDHLSVVGRQGWEAVEHVYSAEPLARVALVPWADSPFQVLADEGQGGESGGAAGGDLGR